MTTTRSLTRSVAQAGLAGLLAAAVALPLSGCVDGPPYFYAERVVGQTFVPFAETVGVYPSQVVLTDPENPFAGPVGAETRWQIQAYGDPVAAFYSWATLLAFEPIGEHQYYVALSLHGIYDQGRAAEDDLDAVRDLAIAAYQSVLDNFPGSVTFDATGTFSFGLATPAYSGIVDLGGTPTGGWTLVTTENGNVAAVKTSDPPPPADEEDAE